MAKNKKKFKPKARLPRGFGDRSPADIRATDEMVAKIGKVFELYGFDPIETPMFEYTEALGKFLPDTDRPNAGVFSLQDDDDQWMSLRYDLTAPLARHVAEDFQNINLPYRTYRNGWVFRNEKPGPGRFRQFMQFDADTVGAPGVQADAEMCMMMADTMEALGIERGDYVIRVNNRKVLDGVMDAIGLGGDENAETQLSVLRAIDKLDKFGLEGVRLLLGEGRKDESGDFTRGAGLQDSQIERVIAYVETGNVDDNAGVAELQTIEQLVRSAGYDQDRIKIDPSCVRGLEYYTGPVFEAELTFAVTNEKGQEVVFGSVGGGGRYDGLVQRFMGQAVPATGFSIGVSRLMTALKNLGKLGHDEVMAPVVVCVMDRDPQSLGRYQKMVKTLRDAGIRSEMFQGNPKNFGKQLQYADRRGCPVAIIAGGDEFAKGEVQIKDLFAGKEMAKDISSRKEWTETRAAQFSIKEADLVAEVQKVLDLYKDEPA
jgi:histidyl-tRNA synthetase